MSPNKQITHGALRTGGIFTVYGLKLLLYQPKQLPQPRSRRFWKRGPGGLDVLGGRWTALLLLLLDERHGYRQHMTLDTTRRTAT